MGKVIKNCKAFDALLDIFSASSKGLDKFCKLKYECKITVDGDYNKNNRTLYLQFKKLLYSL